MLQISILGVPLVMQAGQTVPLPRRHVRGLFYYLAALRQPVSRAQLCLLFWPDFPEANARRNLTRLLTHLRLALPDPQILLVDGDLIGLDWSKLWCDGFEFRRLSATNPASIENLEATVQLYRGPFLSGFDLPDCPDFERWISEERSALEIRYLEGLFRLMGLYAARQNYAKAIACALQYLSTDELAEEIHRRLMMYYAFAGFRAKALRQFETCVTVLEQELGADPLPETRAIYQAVLEDRLPVYQPERVEEVPPAWSYGLKMKIPLVGRSTPLGILETAFQKTRAGQSSFLLISGEPGIGKSRLLHDFMKNCLGSSLVLYGAGQRGEQSVSYHPIVEALRTRLASAPLSLPPYWLAEISRLFPEFASIYPSLPRPLSLKGEEARIRLFEALSQCILALQAASGFVLLCLDDLHWFDATSLNWLMYLSRQFLTKGSRVMVVGTVRTEDFEKVKELRDGLVRLGLLGEIKLAGLEQTDILEILNYLFNHLPGEENFASRLRAATGGNPFFLLELLHMLSEEVSTSVDLNQLVDFPLPEGVREAVNRRLERLSPKSRQVLEAGAVIGPAFDFHTVRMTAGRSEFETTYGLADLVRRQLILEEVKKYRFCHDLVYRTTLKTISPMRLQLLHGRAARAFEKLHPASMTELAYHFEAAGIWDKAFTYHQRSARQAEELFAWQESITHYDRMVQILDEMDPNCRMPERLVQRSEIFEKLARFNHYQSRLPERDNSLKKYEFLASKSQDQKISLKALFQRAYYMHQDGRYMEAVQLVEKGLALVEHSPDESIRGQLLAQLGYSLQFLGQPYQALSALEKAEGIADAMGDIEMRGRILSRMSFIHSLFGHYQKALESQLESYACYRQLNEPYTAARNLPQIGHLYVNLGRFTEAWHALNEILVLARKAGAPSDEGYAFMGLGGYHLCKGEYFQALGCFQQALRMFQTTRAKNLIASSQASLGMVFFHLGMLPEGQASLELGLQTARAIGHHMRIAQALIQLSLVEMAGHDLAPAREHVLEGIAVARETLSKEDLSAGLSALARLERLDGNFDQSLRSAGEALDQTQGLDLAPLEVLARTEAGLTLLASGKDEQARTWIWSALQMAGSVHQRWLGTEEVYLDGAKILQQLGQAEAAQEQMRQANEIIQTKASAIPDPAMRQSFLAKFAKNPVNSL